jgi:hypothetical protein
MAADLSLQWDGERLVESRKFRSRRYPSGGEKLRDDYLTGKDGKTDDYYLLMRVPSYFEDLALQEVLGGIPLEWINKSVGPIVIANWDAWETTIEALRPPGDTSIYENWQQLVGKLNASPKVGWFRRVWRCMRNKPPG